jgi:NAD(P)-dependent dehydrogenase (short-subunit alcohol dehydrogenase family)
VDDRVAIVTGGGTGIGAAAARLLAAQGMTVALVARRREPLDEVADAIGGVAVSGDIAREDDAERMVTAAVERFGRLDVLVNNAGAIRRGVLAHELSIERWDEQVAVNLRGPFLVTRAALRHMLSVEGDRAIVNVASTLAHTAAPGVAPYAAAKGGILALTRALAVEYGPQGIRVNAVCPHIVDTALAAVDRPNWAELRESLPAQFPLRRLGSPEDIHPRRARRRALDPSRPDPARRGHAHVREPGRSADRARAGGHHAGQLATHLRFRVVKPTTSGR